ncbi:MAG: hypothetical protein H0W72_15025, partial [Planctomycetes bacterium]|nr:hypothetical protein [Planctomycetota bacterium]
KVLSGAGAGTDFDAAWARQIASLQGKSGFAVVTEADLPFKQGKAKRLRYSYKEGRYTRLAETILAFATEEKTAVALNGSFTEGEQDAVGAALLDLYNKLVIPKPSEKAKSATASAAGSPADSGAGASPDQPQGEPTAVPAAGPAPASEVRQAPAPPSPGASGPGRAPGRAPTK